VSEAGSFIEIEKDRVKPPELWGGGQAGLNHWLVFVLSL
jgi:hypothetical protein